jgi:hypothetical protein
MKNAGVRARREAGQMVLSVAVIAILFPSPEGFYGAFICNEESSSLGIERPKIQPLKDCRNYATCRYLHRGRERQSFGTFLLGRDSPR